MWLKPKRPPDELIPDNSPDPYIERWYLTRKCAGPFENIYLHRVLRSDDDRALHDHPWWNVSIILKGGYFEIMPVNSKGYKEGWCRDTIAKWRGPGSFVFRKARRIHRLLLPAYPPTETWTLFITGKKSREWGFWCPQGWRHWKQFLHRGCD